MTGSFSVIKPDAWAIKSFFSSNWLCHTGYIGDLPSADGFASPDTGSREGTAAKKLS